jgi:protein-tyrosine phosphatase
VGGAPDKRMTQTAKRKGIDISGLKARQFVVSDFDTFDLIYVMDHSNYDNVVRLSRNEADRSKVQLILELLPNPNEIEVPDPYYGGQDGFEHVYHLLDESTDIILKTLIHE